ncbi:MAG: TetR/AcrR family transcriptional regulator [Clostridia bacterium]|nr:TetR/AcrR family transcriptional regulator [Clostridia bacterium]
MKFEAEIRNTLIENTISLIAEGGFEKATTRAITYSTLPPEGIRPNEVYIYRIFGSKERLFEEAFYRLDNELIYAILNAAENIDKVNSSLRESFYEVFNIIWFFLLRNEARCRSYVRLYYSVYFTGAMHVAHSKSFSRLVSTCQPLFKEEADVRAILHSAFTALLDFAIRVFDGDLENNEDNAYHVFNVVYSTMSAYFKQ